MITLDRLLSTITVRLLYFAIFKNSSNSFAIKTITLIVSEKFTFYL